MNGKNITKEESRQAEINLGWSPSKHEQLATGPLSRIERRQWRGSKPGKAALAFYTLASMWGAL
jgi:hypothetical protein